MEGKWNRRGLVKTHNCENPHDQLQQLDRLYLVNSQHGILQDSYNTMINGSIRCTKKGTSWIPTWKSLCKQYLHYQKLHRALHRMSETNVYSLCRLWKSLGYEHNRRTPWGIQRTQFSFLEDVIGDTTEISRSAACCSIRRVSIMMWRIQAIHSLANWPACSRCKGSIRQNCR